MAATELAYFSPEYTSSNSLFHQLGNSSSPITLIHEQVALNMTLDEIHDDVHLVIRKLLAMTKSNDTSTK